MFQFLHLSDYYSTLREQNSTFLNPTFGCGFYSCAALLSFQRVFFERLEFECGFNSMAPIIRLNAVYAHYVSISGAVELTDCAIERISIALI